MSREMIGRKQWADFFDLMKLVVQSSAKSNPEKNWDNLVERAQENGAAWHLGVFYGWCVRHHIDMAKPEDSGK